jgi:SAM-dependent methyltransferase
MKSLFYIIDFVLYDGMKVRYFGMDIERHWDSIYRVKAPTEVSWYQPEARLSLDLIRRVAPDGAAPIIDVGGGASTLVDGLLEAGYRAVTVLDIAPTALARARERLGERARQVTWVTADVLTASLPAAGYAIWHDRAVFHFLTDPRSRARYVAQTRHAVRAGGYVIAASFGPDGPTRCSGLEVVRYSPEAMHAEFGAGFRLLDSVREDHHTPGGTVQAFIYCLCRVEGSPEVSRP